jgi:hypothetical protein
MMMKIPAGSQIVGHELSSGKRGVTASVLLIVGQVTRQ